jgi:hypothetical protein
MVPTGIGVRLSAFAELGSRMHECEYHQPDWSLIAEIAVRAVESGASKAARLGEARGRDEALAEWVYWLFAHPIFVQYGEEGHSLGNGLHRVCAMKAAGIERCPIEE